MYHQRGRRSRSGQPVGVVDVLLILILLVAVGALVAEMFVIDGGRPVPW